MFLVRENSFGKSQSEERQGDRESVWSDLDPTPMEQSIPCRTPDLGCAGVVLTGLQNLVVLR